MDVVITMFSDFVNAEISESNPIRIAASISTNPDGGASRFSYIDTMIKTLYSDNVTKKIWGLFFESFFGFIYIAAIYALIGFFIYVMLLAAMTYMVTLMKMIFVLALGPIFVAFSLFGQTNSMFKNWLSFIGARSLEMILLFLILYTFVMLIDEKFVMLLRYRVCTHSVNFGLFSFKVLMASVGGRGLIEWFRMILVLGALIYILMEIVKKIPSVAGELISIGGVAHNDDGVGNNASSFGMAGKMLNAAGGLALSGIKTGLTEGGGQAFRAIRAGARASGVSGVMDKIGDKIPFRGPRAMLRDRTIDAAIDKGKAAAASAGHKPGTLAYDSAVRNFVMNGDSDGKNGLLAFKYHNKKEAALLDMTAKTINDRLDKKLVRDPLKKFIKDKTKEIKKGDPSSIPLGKDMEAQLKASARDWADKNLVGGSDSVNDHLQDLKGFMKKHGKLSDDQAAEKFAGNKEMKDKFLQYKQERALEKGKKANTNTGKNFMRKVAYEEARGNTWRDAMGIHTGKGWNPLSRVGWADKLLNKDKFDEQTRAGMERMAGNYLKHGGMQDEKDRLRKEFAEKTKDGVDKTFYGRQLAKKLKEDLDGVDKKAAFLKDALKDKILKGVANEKKGKTEEELAAMRQSAKEAVEDMERKFREDLSNPNPLSARDVANLRDGLVDHDGNSLLEARIRANALGALEGDDASSAKPVAGAASASALEFGATLQDAIGLHVSNVGLSAGKPFLGAEGEVEKSNMHASIIAVRNAMKANAERTAETKKYDLRFKEDQVAKLEAELHAATTPEKKREIEAKLQTTTAEKSRLESEFDNAMKQVQNFEKDIETIKHS